MLTRIPLYMCIYLIVLQFIRRPLSAATNADDVLDSSNKQQVQQQQQQ